MHVTKKLYTNEKNNKNDSERKYLAAKTSTNNTMSAAVTKVKTTVQAGFESGKEAAKQGLRWFYNPVNQPVNAYSVFWVIIMLLAFGIIGLTIGAIATSDNKTLLNTVAGMAGGIAFLTLLGAAFRVMYSEDWQNLLQIDPKDLSKVMKLPPVTAAAVTVEKQTDFSPPPLPSPPTSTPPAPLVPPPAL